MLCHPIPSGCQSDRNMKTVISICIPTYNRKDYLRELLQEIANQSNAQFCYEVCISDNNSTDGTKEFIDNYKANSPFPIKFRKNELNVGAYINIIKAAELATGEYTWLFGDDDSFVSGALEGIYRMIQLNDKVDVFILNRIVCKTNMDIEYYDNYFQGNKNIYANLSSDSEAVSFLKKANSVDALGCFLSSLIVKTGVFSKMCRYVDDNFKTNSFPHVYMLWQYVSQTDFTEVMYVANQYILYRGGNVRHTDVYEKINSLLIIANILKPKGSVHLALKEVIRKHYHHFLSIKSFAHSSFSISQLKILQIGSLPFFTAHYIIVMSILYKYTIGFLRDILSSTYCRTKYLKA
jgi:abequosyltransferase